METLNSRCLHSIVVVKPKHSLKQDDKAASIACYVGVTGKKRVGMTKSKCSYRASLYSRVLLKNPDKKQKIY